MDLNDALGDNAGETVPVTYLRPIARAERARRLGRHGRVRGRAWWRSRRMPAGTHAARAHRHRARRYVRWRSCREDSYLYKAGLRPGDKILRLDGEPVPAWSTFCERVLAAAGPPAPHRLPVRARRPRALAAPFRCAARTSPTSTGKPFSRYVLPMQHWVPLAPDERVEHPAPHALRLRARPSRRRSTSRASCWSASCA